MWNKVKHIFKHDWQEIHRVEVPYTHGGISGRLDEKVTAQLVFCRCSCCGEYKAWVIGYSPYYHDYFWDNAFPLFEAFSLGINLGDYPLKKSV